MRLFNSFTVLITFFTLLFPVGLEAQSDRSGDPPFPLENIYAERQPQRLRKILHHITVMHYVGHGSAGWKHILNGGSLFQKGSEQPVLFLGPPAAIKQAQFSWVTTTPSGQIPIGTIDPDEFLTRLDTANIRFKGSAPVYSVGGRIMYRVWKFQVGARFAWELFMPASLAPSRFAGDISTISTAPSSISANLLSGYLASDLYRYHRLLIRGDLDVGKYSFNKKFTADGFVPSLTIGFGITTRVELSEYFSFFIRPGLDFRSYMVTAPAVGITVKHQLTTPGLTYGFMYTFPELRKCYHKSCRVQINHPHGNREYRSRAHPFYKKQNPGYGENYPEPVKTNRLRRQH